MKNITISDIFIIIGLSGITVGLYMWKPWTAPTTTGAIMLLIGLFGKK